MLPNDLGRSVRGCSADSFAHAGSPITAESEVNKLCIPLIIKKYIFRLNVPMAKPVTLQINQCAQNLMKHLSCVFLAERAIFIDSLKQLPVPTVLHEDQNFVLLTNNLINLSYA